MKKIAIIGKSRYIDIVPIIEFITKGLNNPDKTKALGFDAIQILTEIEYAPTADVVEVRHGYWIEHIEKPLWLEDDVEVYYNCSECGTSHWSIVPPYCPECGAKMDGERSENGTN